MAHVLEQYGLPPDIWLKIENINMKIQHFKIMEELIGKYNIEYKYRFNCYERRFFDGFIKDGFRFFNKYFNHDMHITKPNKISGYHVIYEDHFNIIKYQDGYYKIFY